jgi:hypothetical protein
MKPILVYTAGRVVVFGVLVLLLWSVGLGGFVLLLVALGLSMPLSYLFLYKQRAAMAEELERRMAGRRARREAFRARLRGDDGTEGSEA